jgi:amino-acid N-acetyltransferase
MADILIRKAVMKDIPPLLEIINGYASQGTMLPRTEFEMSENIRDFIIATRDEKILGCAALHFYGPTVAELRSLAVDRSQQSLGLGKLLVEAVDREAREYDLAVVFAFTYVPQFFRKLGYEVVDRGELPLKAWKDCLRCPKFQSCDETAMRKVLRPAVTLEARPNRQESLVALPVPILR